MNSSFYKLYVLSKKRSKEQVLPSLNKFIIYKFGQNKVYSIYIFQLSYKRNGYIYLTTTFLAQKFKPGKYLQYA